MTSLFLQISELLTMTSPIIRENPPKNDVIKGSRGQFIFSIFFLKFAQINFSKSQEVWIHKHQWFSFNVQNDSTSSQKHFKGIFGVGWGRNFG